MDLNLILIVILVVVFILILAYPLVIKDTQVSDQFYMVLKLFRKISAEGKNRQWKFYVQGISPYMNRWAIGKLDRLIRLAGRPSGRTAEEMLIINVVIVVIALLAASQLENARIQGMILALGYPILSISRLKTKKDRRQLEAEEATRFLKRQLVLVLRQQVPVMEALRMMTRDQPGNYGETFRDYLDQVDDGKSLRMAMKGLREEYETRALDDLCLAVELSDLKSPEMLAEQLYLQTLDENARVDEFIEKKRDSTKGMMMLVVGVSFIWTLAVCVFFAYFGFTDYFRGSGGFFNF